LPKANFINKVCLKIIFLKVTKDFMYAVIERGISLFKYPKNHTGLRFGTCFFFCRVKVRQDSFLAPAQQGGECFYCASRVFYYLEVWTWKVLSALSSHWLQCHPVLQPASTGSEGTPHPAADVSPVEDLP